MICSLRKLLIWIIIYPLTHWRRIITVIISIDSEKTFDEIQPHLWWKLSKLRIEGNFNVIKSVSKFLIILGRIDIYDIEAFCTQCSILLWQHILTYVKVYSCVLQESLKIIFISVYLPKHSTFLQHYLKYQNMKTT